MQRDGWAGGRFDARERSKWHPGPSFTANWKRSRIDRQCRSLSQWASWGLTVDHLATAVGAVDEVWNAVGRGGRAVFPDDGGSAGQHHALLRVALAKRRGAGASVRWLVDVILVVFVDIRYHVSVNRVM